MAEGRGHLLVHVLRLGHLAHGAGQHVVGLLAHALPGVAEAVDRRVEDGEEVGPEGAAETVDEQADDVQAVLGDLEINKSSWLRLYTIEL